MAVARVQKMVLITVYEVKPRRRRLSFSKNHHARLRPSHQHSGGAYNRRAELLQYCQQLRAHGHQTGTTSRAIPRNQHTSNKIVPAYRNQSEYKKLSPRSGQYWKRLLLPNFVLRSLGNNRKKRMSESIRNTMNTIVRSFHMQKKPGFVVKFLSTFRRRR
ncbi:uncharacterized protein LOC120272494 [Dioscorea cayenensis subsp. rotundata]|uniref:Uncharacterized protein LOC120272494 n=1 Tax=Dioscorea cayennensis subsp. rotundata TaxID=55577 RepID=A0AB40C8Y5_DIOCR|nr:uncharacterized protein LOC120272494 [Dioscorea cayenensis subsp. rotundata]